MLEVLSLILISSSLVGGIHDNRDNGPYNYYSPSPDSGRRARTQTSYNIGPQPPPAREVYGNVERAQLFPAGNSPSAVPPIFRPSINTYRPREVTHQPRYSEPQHEPYRKYNNLANELGYNTDDYGKNNYRKPEVVEPRTSNYMRLQGFAGEIPTPFSRAGQALGPEKIHPDQSTGCFEKFGNSLVTNAQPYERRSIHQNLPVSLGQCEQFCLTSQCLTCSYRCHGFVYDRTHQVCDLFSHSGRVYPAKLRQYHSRDYYELRRHDCPALPSIPAPTNPFEPPTTPSTTQRDSCPLGTESRFTKLSGISAESSQKLNPIMTTRQNCLQLCAGDNDCKVVEYKNSKCVFFANGDVPQTGLENEGSDVFLRLCISTRYLGRCPGSRILFERFPQKVLIGYADEVILDSGSEQDCIESCLRSPSLKCQSIIYYKDAKQCILNEETRETHSESFSSDENEDVVYVDILCPRRRKLIFRDSPTHNSHRLPPLLAVSDQRVEEQKIDAPRSSKRTKQTLLGDWTEWSDCDRSEKGRRIRHRRCHRPILSTCPFQTEWCDKSKDGAEKSETAQSNQGEMTKEKKNDTLVFP